jgi:sugar phosphate isomerase/epimerase
MFPFKASLNASTLFPFKLDVKQQLQIAAAAGYDGIELWVRDIESYLKNGGTISELKSYADEAGLTIVNAIAFFKWADVDEQVRAEGFVQAEREMRMLAELGCLAVAAPPFGDVADTSLDTMAEQFARLSALAAEIGIKPYLEFWGRAKTLSKLSEVVFVAIESGLPDVQILLDPFHMYTGGSEVGGLRYLKGANIGVVHVNDYPAEPIRAAIADRDRVFPGEGIAPSSEFATLLYQIGYRGYLSLELFIEDFGEASALDVAKRGLKAIKTAYQVQGEG